MNRTLFLLALPLMVAAAPPVLAASQSDQVIQGHQLYTTLCARCHGEDLANPQNGSPDLRHFPANRHDLFVSIVEDGKDEMPSWKGLLSPEQIEQIWAYVKANGK